MNHASVARGRSPVRRRIPAVLALGALVGSLVVCAPGRAALAEPVPGGGQFYGITGSKPSSIAAGSDGDMWFTEQGKNKIGRISPSGSLHTFAVPTSDAWPSSITPGPDGNMWFTEPGKPKGTAIEQVGMITPSGAVTEYSTSPYSPGSITAGPDGNLWITENEGGAEPRLAVISPTGNKIAVWSVEAMPTDIVAGPDGNLWFTVGSQIGRITPTGSISYFTIPDSQSALDIAPGGTALWFTTVVQVSGAYDIGEITTSGAITLYPIPGPTGGGVTQPMGITAGPDGNIWATLNGTDQLVRVNTQPGIVGQMTTYDVPVSGGPAGPYAIAAGVNGDVWFTDYTAGGVVDFPVSPVVSQYAAPSGANAIFGLAPGPVGDEWFSDYSDNQMDRICQNGTLQTYNVPTVGGGPYGVTEGPYPHRISQQVVGIWFTEYSADKIGVIPESGGDAEDACGTVTPTDYTIPTAGAEPSSITTGPDGALWFTEFGADQIGRITDTGSVTEYPLPTPGAEPEDIVTGPDGNLWFTELHADQIGRITPAGVVTEFPIPTANSEPDGIAAGPDGNLWFTEANADQIGRITTGGVVNEYPVPTAESEPLGIAAGPDGNLWFTELEGDQVGRITTAGTVTEYSLGEAEFPRAISATASGLDFSDRSGGDQAIATLAPPGSNALVLPSGPTPSTSTVPFGSSLTWTVLAPAPQTITDSSSLNLYTTPTLGLGAGSTFSFRFIAAGNYPYIAQPVGTTTKNGIVKVPIVVAPGEASAGVPPLVTWASEPAPFPYVYDVQVEVPGGSFKTWLDGTTASSASYSGDGAAGSYIFRARLRNTSTGEHSGWSPEEEFEAT